MSNTMQFSIVVPTFNSQETILQTLDSIAEQNHPDTQVVVIDGSSRDKTVEIARSYRKLRLLVSSEPDLGIYDAINKGVRTATGQLICVLGSDDILLPNSLTNVCEVWSQDRTDIVAGASWLEQKDGSLQLRMDEPFGINALVSGIPFCHNAMFVTRETYSRVGGYDLKYKICADAAWVHRAIRAKCSCAILPIPLVKFGYGGASSTRNNELMRETYSVVRDNFPFLTIEEAEHVFKVARRWVGSEQVASIVSKYRDQTLFVEAVQSALSINEATNASTTSDQNRKKGIARVLASLTKWPWG